jgi:hypothetical protein
MRSFLRNALIYLSSVERYSNFLAKRVFAAVNTSTNPWYADVAVAKFARYPMVASAI